MSELLKVAAALKSLNIDEAPLTASPSFAQPQVLS